MVEILLLTSISLCLFSILWYTLKTGITPMPSSAKACQAIVTASRNSGEGKIIDLGSGWGTLLFALARQYSDRELIGYERSWLPWLWTRILIAIFRLDNVTIYRQDFFTADLSAASLIVTYLHPEAMRKLQKKLIERQWDHTLLISNTFALPEHEPIEIIRIDDLYNTPVYIYQL